MRCNPIMNWQAKDKTKIGEKINLTGFAFGSCIVGSFIYILPKICHNPTWGFGVVASFVMFIAGFCAGLISGVVLAFLIWFLFRISKSAIYKIHYILVSLLGLFIGFEFMRFLDKTRMFLR